MTHSDEVSDERLAEILAAIPRYADGSIRRAWVGRVPAPELEALVTELLSHRSASNTAGGPDRDSVRFAKQFADQYRSGAQGAQMDYDAAQALALSIDDILSALEPIQAGGDEPVAWLDMQHATVFTHPKDTAGLLPVFTRPATPVSAEVTADILRRWVDLVDLVIEGPEPDEALGLLHDALTAALATLDRGRG